MYPGFVLIMYGKRCRHRNDGRDGSLYAQIPGDRRHTTLAQGPMGKHEAWSEDRSRAKGKYG